MGARCSSQAAKRPELPASAPQASAALPRPDPHLVIRAITAARTAGVSAEAARAFAQRGPPMPLGTGVAVEADWAIWSAELTRTSAAGIRPQLEAKRSTCLDDLLRRMPCIGASCALPGAGAAEALPFEALPLPCKFAALRPDGGGCRIPETASRAITLPQLERVFALAKELCVAEQWTDAITRKLVAPARLNLYHLNAHLIRPATAEAVCSLVELLAEGAQPPDVFVSHWWGEPVADFVACLRQFCKDLALDAQSTRFWVCAYALNQHDLAGELPQGGLASGPFVRALLFADCALSVLDADGVYFQRAWCGYELYKAVVDCLPGFKHHLVTAAPGRRSAPAVCLIDGFAKQDDEVGVSKAWREGAFPPPLLAKSRGFSLETVEASEPGDLLAIQTEVGDRRQALEATLRVRFGMRALVDPQTPHVQLAQGLRDLASSQLRSLSLTFDDQQTEARALQLCEALPQSLVDVRFDSGHPALAVGLAKSALGRDGPLLALGLRGCKLDAERPLRPLLAVLARSGRQLRKLDLRDNSMFAEEGAAVGQALRHVPQLQALALSRNQLGAEGGMAVAQALRYVPQLQALHLSRNQLGDEGCTAVAQSLRHVPKLQTLYLERNQLGAEGGTAVGRALRYVPQLQALALSGNQLGAEGGTAVARALRYVPQLQALALSDNKLGAEGCSAVAQSLRYVPQLQTLELRGNELGDAAKAQLQAAKGKLTALWL